MDRAAAARLIDRGDAIQCPGGIFLMSYGIWRCFCWELVFLEKRSPGFGQISVVYGRSFYVIWRCSFVDVEHNRVILFLNV